MKKTEQNKTKTKTKKKAFSLSVQTAQTIELPMWQTLFRELYGEWDFNILKNYIIAVVIIKGILFKC